MKVKARIWNLRSRDRKHLWNGRERYDCISGAWTNLYSNGNFGKRYAFGGTWTSQHNFLLEQAGRDVKPQEDKSGEFLVLGANNDLNLQQLPDGIKGEIKITDIDCSVGWTIWYPDPIEALNQRLDFEEIQKALGFKAKSHYRSNQQYIESEIGQVREILGIYKFKE